jgi:hypothetical protein
MFKVSEMWVSGWPRIRAGARKETVAGYPYNRILIYASKGWLVNSIVKSTIAS